MVFIFPVLLPPGRPSKLVWNSVWTQKTQFTGENTVHFGES